MPGGGRGFGRGGRGCGGGGGNGRGGRWGRRSLRGGGRGGDDGGKDNSPEAGSRQRPAEDRENSAAGVVPGPAIRLEQLKVQAEALERELAAVRAQMQTAEVRKPHPVAVVDDVLCTRCGTCVAVCPNDAIVMNDMVHIDEEKCSGCGACVPRCRFDAIRLVG
jgi:ferredoxin